MTIKIKLLQDDCAQSSIGTRVYNQDGKEIEDVTGLKVGFPFGGRVTATIEVCVADIVNMDNIHALLGTSTLEQIATLHGKVMSDAPTHAIGEVTLGVDFS